MERVQKEKANLEAPNEYLIYFVDKDELHWWDYLFHTRAGFRHCFVLHWDEWAQRWLLMDWRRHKLDSMILFDFEAEQLLTNMSPAKLTVVSYNNPADFSGPDPLFLSYCSNILGHLLGLGNNLILTPYQLYRRLMAAGGKVVFDWRIHHDPKDPENHTRATSARS